MRPFFPEIFQRSQTFQQYLGVIYLGREILPKMYEDKSYQLLEKQTSGSFQMSSVFFSDFYMSQSPPPAAPPALLIHHTINTKINRFFVCVLIFSRKLRPAEFWFLPSFSSTQTTRLGAENIFILVYICTLVDDLSLCVYKLV